MRGMQYGSARRIRFACPRPPFQKRPGVYPEIHQVQRKPERDGKRTETQLPHRAEYAG